ncbi:hypothetical protein [Methyloceanibacter sp.]|uniref:hypothetical protein n=1 Tax=Methyloceanibacter sp. TaxID=1965321 RepID=UPI0020834127|nr:hypothetical protein [Methyloceanibacter sp.]GFO81452.1 MAG: hypothetical protein A49_10790 [Methyloceanibacter sp.]HML92545.1 hypothetical protein [Methyloceanibacter sp.]
MRVGIAVAVLLSVGCFVLYVLFIGANPYDREAEQVKKAGEQLDAEIESARSFEECQALAANHIGRMIMDGQFEHELSPTPDELRDRISPNTRTKKRLHIERLNAEMKKAIESNFKAMGSGALYMTACIQHLDKIGVMSYEDGLKKIKQIVLEAYKHTPHQ